MVMRETNARDIPIVSYFQPVGEGAILITPTESRLTANGQMFALMKEHQDARLCKVTDDDDYSTVASIKDDILTVTLINAGFSEDRAFDFKLKGTLLGGTLYSSDDVTAHTYFTESPLSVVYKNKILHTVLPAHSVAIFRMKIR